MVLVGVARERLRYKHLESVCGRCILRCGQSLHNAYATLVLFTKTYFYLHITETGSVTKQNMHSTRILVHVHVQYTCTHIVRRESGL